MPIKMTITLASFLAFGLTFSTLVQHQNGPAFAGAAAFMQTGGCLETGMVCPVSNPADLF